MKTIAIAFGITMLAGSAHAISDEGWFCPPGTDLYQGQCWAPTHTEQPVNVTATGKGGNATAVGKGAGSKAVSGSTSKSGAHSVATGRSQANNAVNVDASSYSKAAAASAIASQLNGYGVQNCFGDINPSGSFTAGMQTFGWGVAAGSSKASNVCAVYAIGGPAAAMAYLQKMDRNVPRNVTVVQPTKQTPLISYTCPEGSAWDGKGCWKPGGRK